MSRPAYRTRSSKGVVYIHDLRNPGGQRDFLPHQLVGMNGRFRPLSSARQFTGNERAQSQTLTQLAYQQQTTVGSDPRALEINFQTGVKRELKGLILFLTHWVEPP
jgi:hypothetical protein